MALFRRERSGLPEPSPDGPRDANLPMLSAEQAAALGALAERAFRQHGVAATYDGAGSLHSDGVRFGLHNLATAVADVPWKNWWPVVDNHVRALRSFERTEERAAPIRPEQMLLQLSGDDLVDRVDYDAASPFPGLLALAAVDLPTHVKALLNRELLDEVGGPEAFREQALRNLRALPAPKHAVIPADDARADSNLYVFEGADYFVASRALVLDDLLRTALKVERPAAGCLVAVPNRHLLIVHVLEGVGVLAALRALASIAEGQHDGPGPVSPDVFYVPPDGPVERVTHREDGELRVVVDGRLAAAFTRLGLLE